MEEGRNDGDILVAIKLMSLLMGIIVILLGIGKVCQMFLDYYKGE